MKNSRWLLISPPKIFWAVSWLKSTMSGRAWAVTNFFNASSVASPSNTALPSSKCLNKTTDPHFASYLAYTSSLLVIPNG
uniref:Protein disulfide isomerase prolyl 4-hydroxylase beta subunit n=1 Tax=Anopheles marajoara TaxID=58244 RepID=A0A2M4CBT4_9DIPT